MDEFGNPFEEETRDLLILHTKGIADPSVVIKHFGQLKLLRSSSSTHSLMIIFLKERRKSRSQLRETNCNYSVRSECQIKRKENKRLWRMIWLHLQNFTLDVRIVTEFWMGSFVMKIRCFHCLYLTQARCCKSDLQCTVHHRLHGYWLSGFRLSGRGDFNYFISIKVKMRSHCRMTLWLNRSNAIWYHADYHIDQFLTYLRSGCFLQIRNLTCLRLRAIAAERRAGALKQTNNWVILKKRSL